MLLASLASSHGGALGAFLLVWLLVLLLGLAVFIMSIVVTVQAYKAGRQGWWVYLIAVFVGPFNLIAVIAWYAHLRKNPVLDSKGRPFL